MNCVVRVAVKVRIARIDLAKVGQQRDQPSAALIDAVPDTVQIADGVPRKEIAYIIGCKKMYFAQII